MIKHNAMRAFGFVFQLLSSLVAAIFEATKMAASGPQRNRNINKHTHCIVVDHAPLRWRKCGFSTIHPDMFKHIYRNVSLI
jgi:hypothetical protein